MKTFTCTITKTYTWQPEIEAANVKEAIDKLDAMIETGGLNIANAQKGYLDIGDMYDVSEPEVVVGAFCFDCKHRPPEHIQNEGYFDCPRRPQSCGDLNSRDYYDCWEEPNEKDCARIWRGCGESEPVHKEIKLKIGGSIFIEQLGNQEEEERIKIYDSNMDYLDYIPVERIYELAEEGGVVPEKWLEEECYDYENAETIWALLDLILDLPYSTPMSWEEVLEDEIEIEGLTKENTANSGISRIGEYYFYVGD